MRKSALLKICIGFMLFLGVLLLTDAINLKLDLTEDKRYTLSEAAKQTTSRFEDEVIIDIFLEGNLPTNIVRLQEEMVQLLKEFQTVHKGIRYNLVDPLTTDGNNANLVAELNSLGLSAVEITENIDGEIKLRQIFPWALVNYGNKTVTVNLLKNKIGNSPETLVNNSVQNLEYAFTDAFSKLLLQNKKSIAVVTGNGELEDKYIDNYIRAVRPYFSVGKVSLDSVENSPVKTLEQLKVFDLALIAKPTQAFTDKEKYVLDQYIAGGGKSIWLVEKLGMELDTLYNNAGSSIPVPHNLNFDELLFRYGIRVNPEIVNDYYCTYIGLETGAGRNAQQTLHPWVYYPKVNSQDNHPINTKIEAIKLQFTNTIDTLSRQGVKHTVLLQSSPNAKAIGPVQQISLENAFIPPNKNNYPTDAHYSLAVLTEGKFTSSFNNKPKPFKYEKHSKESKQNQIVVIGDGDLIKNQTINGVPQELGYDIYTRTYFGNKDFIVNTTIYLLDNMGLLNLRAKQIIIPQLDSKKIAEQKSKWQFINIALPILITILLGIVFNFWRRKKFTV